MGPNSLTEVGDSTIMHTHETRYTWIIKNIRNCPFEKGGHYTSPGFVVGQNKEYSWKLNLYLNGYVDENYVGIWPHILNVNQYWDYKEALVEITIQDDQTNNNISRRTYLSKENLISREDSTVFTKFVQKDELLKIPSFVEKGDLKIVCSIFFSNYVYSIKDVAKSTATHEKMNEHLADFEKLLFDDEYSDFQLIIGDTKIPVHRAILASRSRVFFAMLSNDMLEKNKGTATITDVEVEVMRELLRFVYIGQVRNLDKYAQKILIAAGKYELNPLKQICENELAKRLSAGSIFATLQFADMYDATTLKRVTIEYITKIAKHLAAKDNFEENIKQLSPELSLQLIRALIAKT